MNVVGIIAEYNPFHNGHLYHLKQAKALTRCSYAVVVMSPNFVQRGAPAITNKWARTKMALESGADLVIELPTPYATASAEFFARASVSLLSHTGIVSALNFGSEANEIGLLTEVAAILVAEPAEFKLRLKEHLGTGMSFPSARAKALIQYAQSVPNLSIHAKEIQAIIGTPNNILGIEYLKALNALGASITPSILRRKGAAYHQHDLSGQLSSATAIRGEIYKGNWDQVRDAIPGVTYDLLAKDTKAKDLWPFLAYPLLFSTPEDLRQIAGVSEGLENRILKVFQKAKSMTDMITGIKSKRFTQTTIERILLSIILQLTKEDFNTFEAAGGPQYIRLLGFRKSSSHLLTELTAKATLPVLMNIGKDHKALGPLGQQMLSFEIRATNLYNALDGSPDALGQDYTQPLVII